MRAGEIAAKLARDAEGVASYLLPNGKRDGHEWVCGNVHGDEGKSLKVHLTGDKAGIWKDFSEGSGGDLLDLWAAVHQSSIGDAIREAKLYLGIHDTPLERHEVQLPRVGIPDEKPSGRVLDFLKARGLSGSIEAYRVRQEGNSVVFPYFVGDRVSFAKCRDVDDKSKMRCLQGGKAVLFGWQAIREQARAVVICEGELDAMAWYDMGCPALSVPNGAQGHSWVEVEYNRLEQFDQIFIAFDTDEQGQSGAKALVERLGTERCRMVDTSPHKDGNDLLLAGGDGKAILKRAPWLDPIELRNANDYTEAVINFFRNGFDSGPGFDSPWPKLRGNLRFREAELTIINGVNGHGKSQLVGQLVLDAMQQGWKVCKASMEMKPEILLGRMARQASGGKTTDHKINALGNWYSDKFWLFDLVGTAKGERLLEVFAYARKRYDCRLFVVDSLLKCGIGEDDYNGQKRFVEALCDFKNQYNAHVILVTHSRKGDSEEKPTGKMDVRGTGAITDLADTVIGIWRNKRKERKISELAGEPISKELQEEFDALLMVDKQRNGDWEGRARLWFDPQSHQFRGGIVEDLKFYGGVRAV